MSNDELFKDFANDLELEKDEAATTVTGNVVKMEKKQVNIGPIIDKLKLIEKDVCNNLIERDEVVRDCMLALVSKNHIFLYGPPGTAKSKLVNEINKRIDCTGYFKTMLNKTTDISEVFGPFSIAAMEKDKMKRITKDKLPEAYIVFLDEIFKCNSPILNGLLTALNERVFYNDGEVEIPLLTMFCASNEIPYEDELMALYDRIMFRENVEYVKDINNRITMYKNFISNIDSKPKYKISLQELNILQDMVYRVAVPDKIMNNFEAIMLSLSRDHGISISDRRKNACFRILQANALLDKRKAVIGDDFESLVNVLWTQPSDIDTIRIELIKMCNPYKSEFNEHIGKINEFIDKINDADNDNDRDQLVIESKGPLEKLLTKMNNTINNANIEGRDTNEMTTKLMEISSNVQSLVQKSLGFEVPNINTQSIPVAENITDPDQYVKDNSVDFNSAPDINIAF